MNTTPFDLQSKERARLRCGFWIVRVIGYRLNVNGVVEEVICYWLNVIGEEEEGFNAKGVRRAQPSRAEGAEEDVILDFGF